MDLKLTMLIRFIFVTSVFGTLVSGACNWPTVFTNTVWQDSSKGEIVFTIDTLSGWTIKRTGWAPIIEYDRWICHSDALYETDNILISRSEESVDLFQHQFFLYMCMELTEITEVSFRYYLHVRQESNIDNERVFVSVSNDDTDFAKICSYTPDNVADRPNASEYRVILKSSNLDSTRIHCPYTFLGSYDYSHTSSDGTVTCNTSPGSLTTCTESTDISFDYTTCSTKIAYSVSDSVWCVDTVPSGGNNYVTLYNGNDEDSDINNSDVFRFSCLSISSDGTLASIVPNSCRKDQTPESPDSTIGATLTLSKTEDCLTCPLVNAPDSGNVSYTSNGAVTTANYACDSQYSLAGPDTRICQNNNLWEGEEPTCTCIVPAQPSNGSFELSVDGTLTYSCDIGFVLNGDRTRNCQSDANTWSGIEPSCDVCGDISITTGLNISVTSTGETTISYFTCMAGYTIDGRSNTTCLQSGAWDTDIPACVECAEIVDTGTGTVVVTTDGYISVATFTCVIGYHIVGDDTATCDNKGSWSSIPTCECDDQGVPANGSMTGNGTSSAFSCGTGFNLIGSSSIECLDDGSGWSADPPTCAVCDDLSGLDGGFYNLTTDGLVTIVTYSCYSGYSMSGERFAYCQDDGSWNQPEPTCSKCPDLVSPNSGAVKINTDGVTSSADYACATGYDISGDVTNTCLIDGTWTNAPPSCSCSAASVPDNGAISSDDGESVYYQCSLNYSMNGSSVRFCATDGTGWSGTDPICVECESLTPVIGGSYVPTTNDVNTKVEYSCDVGYTIKGRKEITCNSDGTWDSDQSTCTECSGLTAPSGGNLTMYKVDGVITRATFTCDVGYVLDGYNELTCEDTGLWDNDVPTCVECKYRSDPAAGSLTFTTDGQTTTGTYSCTDGYEVVGQQIITCRIDGNWNHPSAECKCQTPGAPDNGFVQANGSTVTYTCSTGYTMSGDSTGTCNTDGTGWSIQTPQCVECESLTNFTSGNISYISDGYTTVVQYTCPQGSSLQGSAVVSCTSDGVWAEVIPECVSCPTLPSVTIPTGSVTLVTNGTTTTADYTCPSGYEVKGSPSLTCNPNGNWSDIPSDCVCEAPSVPDGGGYTLSEDGLSVTFTCDKGYTIDGTQTISCGIDGSGWQLQYPNCTKCDNLTHPSNGSITLVTSGTQTTAVYSCEPGYTLDGTSQPTCQSDGTWTTVEQTCVSCTDLPAVTIEGGSVSIVTNGTTTTAVYNCPVGYEVSGQEVLTCTSTGSWNDSPSTCVCERPSVPSGGSYTLSEDGLSVSFTCEEGYTMSGVQEVTCSTDGSGWQMTFPNCTQCGMLTAPDGGNLELATNGSQTEAIFTCDVGSSLHGVYVPVCQTDGSWSATEPTCVTCPELPDVSVSTGNVTVMTNGSTTTAVYNCPEGYEVKGSYTLTCHDNGTWSDTSADCVCETPNPPEGGNFLISDDGFNIVFTCEQGYTLQGVQSSSCNTDGLGWEIEYPNCTKCEELVLPSYGNVTMVTDGRQTTAMYSCSVGFSLDGTAEPKCQSDGTWTSVEQTCVSCPSLPEVSITGGSVSLVTNGTTTTAVYSCPTGYEINGHQVLTCNSSGYWDSTPSTCVCKTPSVPSGGSYTLSEDGLSVSFTCEEGYTMSGVQEVTCSTDGSGWQMTFPNCTQCGDIGSPDGGEFTLVTDGAQTAAVYTCSLGYSLVGEAVLVCNSDGTWLSIEPTCVSCPNLPDVSISTGNVTLITNGTVTIAIYNCPAGYEVNGSDVIQCGTDGAWDSTPSDCVCNSPDLSEGINYTFTDDGLTATFTCAAGYTMVGEQTLSCDTSGSGWNLQQPNCTKCEALATPANGNLLLTSEGTQTTAVYTCELGYTLGGDAAPICQTDGVWTAYEPVCVSCPELENIVNGNTNVSTDGQTTAAIYTCSDGYEMAGSPISTCLVNGSWNTTAPTCFCQAPSDPLFGSVVANTTTAVYSCNEGYILKGTSIRTCQDNGQGWTGSAPTCTTCDALSDIEDGSYSLTTNGTVTIATFSCGVKYSMNGTQTLICLEDGSWSNEVPICVECPTLVQPSSGTLSLSTDNVMTSATYACASGYYIVGEDLLVCSSDGQWSADQPFCACDAVTSPDNGAVEIDIEGGLAIYTCDVGYTIDGVSTRSCAKDGTGWSHSTPTCVGCPNVTSTVDGDFDLVTDGTVTSVIFKCDNGASLDGSATLTCQSDGQWTSTQPKCVVCLDLPELTSGNVTMETNGVTSSVTYTCSENYDIVGDVTRECQTDGTWSGTNSTCVCTPPSSPDNGTFTLVNDSMVVMYTCYPGYSLSGSSVRVCQEDGSGWTGSDPTCVLCPTLEAPEDGSVTTETNGTRTIATFVCTLGTSLKGQASSVCLHDETWSSTEPICVSCPTISDPDSGTVMMSTDDIITVANYACATGYLLNGENETTCRVSGSWSNTAPECLCEDPDPIANGTVVSDGRQLTYACNIGYSLRGSSGASCQAGGLGWSDTAPECVQCSGLTELNDGHTHYTTTGINTMVEFTCDVGTTLNGSVLLMCHIDGSWNGTVPSCVTCEGIAAPANGVYAMITDGATTSAELQCNEGYEVTGATSIVCTADGTWSINQHSTCEKSEVTGDSLLTALIAVSLVSMVIITILSILLARFVYLYLHRKRNKDNYDVIMPFENPSYDDLPLASVKLKPSIAPRSHESHVLDTLSPFSTSLAPQSFKDNKSSKEEEPDSPLPVETHRSGDSVISFKRATTSLTNKSIASFSHITISPNKESTSLSPSPISTFSNGLPSIQDNEKYSIPIPDPKSNRLSPIPGHKRKVQKLTLPSPKSNQIKTKTLNIPNGNQSPMLRSSTPKIDALKSETIRVPNGSDSPVPIRSTTPTMMSHSINVSNVDSKSISSVSMVD